jgi:hypothetical protein
MVIIQAIAVVIYMLLILTIIAEYLRLINKLSSAFPAPRLTYIAQFYPAITAYKPLACRHYIITDCAP